MRRLRVGVQLVLRVALAIVDQREDLPVRHGHASKRGAVAESAIPILI